MTKYKTWKTIKIGTGFTTAEDFCLALRKARCNIAPGCNTEVKAILNSPAFNVSLREVEVELVNETIAGLGFKGLNSRGRPITGASSRELYSRAKDLGLDLCPAEVGPQLCRQYSNHPNVGLPSVLVIGMNPITTTPGPDWQCIDSLFVLYENKNRNPTLMALKAAPGTRWAADERFVFIKRT